MNRTVLITILLAGCLAGTSVKAAGPTYPWKTTVDSTNALCRRIAPPPGYQRVAGAPGSFAGWLQHLPLKPGRPMVYYFDGIEKENQNLHYAVVDIDVGRADLQQCADAVIRLRAEYLYSIGDYGDIHFNYTSGDRVAFSSWIQGYRPMVRDEALLWVQSGNKGASYENFRKYLVQIFMYSGTLSLSGELKPVPDPADMQVGDVFIRGGSPGHAELVVDMAVEPSTGKKVFLLAQSFMPAQDVHVLINPSESSLSPWYSLDFGDSLRTPEWTFSRHELKRF